MTRLIILLALGTLVLSAPLNVSANPSADLLKEISDTYVQKRQPGATAGVRTDFSAAAFEADIEEQRRQLDRLLGIDSTALTLEQDIDRRLLIGMARSDINTALAQRRWEQNPSLYLPASQLGLLTEKEFSGSEQERLDKLSALVQTIPGRLASARSNLKSPPLRFTKAALFQAQQSIQSLDEGLKLLPDLDATQQSIFSAAGASLREYEKYLREELLPESNGDWRLGQEAYDFILQNRWYMDADAEQILQRGLKAFEETEALAQEVSERIEAGKHWTEVYEKLKDDHPDAADIKQAYQHQMDLARDFVLANSVLTLPEGERVITIDTPPAMRRSSPFGTFQTASPFDGGLEGKLILTPIEDWMPADQQAQRLRSHHTAWIPVIAAHEAYPGHHAQALKVNENPNMLRRVIRESIFSEGWGLFTEELMFELGFLQGDDVRLTQLRNRLWRAARVILDVSLHTGRMTFDEAVEFMVEKVRFEPYAAELEVGMYVRRPTYVLGYLIGMQEIEAIREEYIMKFGQPERPSDFYDQLLFIGSIPPALLKEELFDRANASVPKKVTMGPVVEGFGPVFPVPADSTNLEPGKTYKVVMDIGKGSSDEGAINRHIVTAARFLNMHAQTGIDPSDLDLAIVLHGGATHAAVNHEAYRAKHDSDNPDVALIAALADAGVQIYLCGQSAGYHGYQQSDLLPGVTLAVSAMTAHIRLQSDGYRPILF